jgi:hypothetical protein
MESDVEVFEAIRAMAMAGEYLDSIPGKPDTSAASVRLFGGGMRRRIYRRGSRDYLEARQAGLIERLPPLARASADQVSEAEVIVGQELPVLLRRLYLEVGNGGFGPGYGVLGLGGGHRDDTGMTAIDLCRQAHGSRSSAWSFLPTGLLPLCHWGCAIYSFVDCSHPGGRMWAWDPNPGPVGREALFDQAISLADWLGRWVACQLCQPTLVHDAETGRWRAASDAEMNAWLQEPDGA